MSLFLLFSIAFAAWGVYCLAVLAIRPPLGPRLAWLSSLALGGVLVLIALRFAFMDGEIPLLPFGWETEDGQNANVGRAAPLVLVYDVFALLGPMGNAFVWGLLGLWFLRGAFNGGWYRLAEGIHQAEEEEQARRVAKVERDRKSEEAVAVLRGMMFERAGMALGRALRKLVQFFRRGGR